MRAIRFHENGGPDVLRLEDVPVPEPGPGEILIRHAAIGVNFVDTYYRGGLYPAPLPSGVGTEAAGMVERVGEGVTAFAVGDRAAYCTGPMGAYSEAHVVPAGKAVKLPAGVSFDVAAAALLKGLTARSLLKVTYPIKPGEPALIYAAAGGVGQILVQWAKHLGAVVIAVVGSEAKAEIAKRLGADHVLLSDEPIAQRVRALTGGEGAAVAYDSVGKDTFEASLDSLRPLGMMVTYGNASGPPPAIAPSVLQQRGSLFLTRPTLFQYVRTPALLAEAAEDFFPVVEQGIVKIEIGQRLPLERAADAHRALESRGTVGATVLTP